MERSNHTAIVPGAVTVALLCLFLAGCGPQEPAATAPPAATPAAEPAAPPTDAPSAEAVAASLLTPEALEELLAPIALYPDSILGQVLVSATNPQQVLDAGNWLIANQELKGRELDDAAEPLGFSPSTRALLQFPEVIDMMCMELDWTTRLGEAFDADQAAVLDAVQRLRRQATEAGNLASSEQLKVETETQEGKEVVTVAPADPEVVYVPKYDPVAVYAPPPATVPAPTTTTTTTAEKEEGHSTGALITTGLLSFGAGLLVAEVFDDDDDWDDYYPNYGYGGMYYGPRPYYPPPPYAYRPAYGGGFQPGYGYNRPPNYQNGFNNNTIIVNNQGNDYWNSFDDKPGSGNRQPRSPISKANPNRPELADLDRQASERRSAARPRPADSERTGWQGQKSYEDARQATDRARAKAPTAGNKVQGSYAGATAEGKAARDKMVASRPAPPTVPGRDRAPAQAARPSTGSVDKGYGDSARNASRGSQQARSPAPNQAARPAPDRTAPTRSSRPPVSRDAPPKGSPGFSGSNRGQGDRAASQRGRQSMPQGARSKGTSKAGGAKPRQR